MLYDVINTEVVISVCSFLLGMTGAWFMSMYANRLGLLDMPNLRSSHVLPTPNGGGVGIVAAFTLSAIVMQIPIGIWFPTTLLAALSFFDDRARLSPVVRLACQFFAALIVVKFIGAIAHEHIFSIPMIIAFSFFIVATTNFFNFMDGINGIAGITGATSFLLIAFFSYIREASQTPFILSFSMALACLGFLPFNFPRAKVFMGDVGSILLGFTFSVFVLWLSKSFADFLCLASFIFPFYADTLTTLYIRFHDGERLTQAHRKHLYQILANELGHPHWQVSLGYGVMQTLFGLLMIGAWYFGLFFQLFVLITMKTAFVIYMLRLRRSAEALASNNT